MRRAKIRPKQWVVFMAIVLIAGGFWYLRNLMVFKTPIYPVPFSRDSISIYSHNQEKVALSGFLSLIPLKLLALWKDIGLGTLNGGYGLVFWGLAFPSWFYLMLRAIIQKKWFEFWIYFPLVAGIGQLLWVTYSDYIWIARYSLFVVVLGLLALGQVMMIFERIGFFGKTIKVLCAMFSAGAVVLLSVGVFPGYHIDVPVENFVGGRYTTEQSYGIHSMVWAALDYLTANAGKGVSFYIASKNGRGFFPVAYAYGTKLQNRPWNFQVDKTRPPGAFLYSGTGGRPWSEKWGPWISPQELMANPDYMLIIQTSTSFFFMRKDFFQTPEEKYLLANYYKTIAESALSQFNQRLIVDR